MKRFVTIACLTVLALCATACTSFSKLPSFTFAGGGLNVGFDSNALVNAAGGAVGVVEETPAPAK